jgi:CHAT domain-containing protein/Tfp pilus assembly protein PilF
MKSCATVAVVGQGEETMRYLSNCLLVVCLFATLSTFPVWASPQRQLHDPLDLCRQGIELYEQGDMLQAFSYLETGFQQRSETTSPSSAELDIASRCAALLGEIYEFQGERDLAAAAYQAAVEAAQQNDNLSYQATALLGLGSVHHKQGDFQTALDASQQALAAARKAVDTELEAKALMQLAASYHATGDLMAALQSVELALPLYQEKQDQIGEGTAKLFQGNVNLALGRLNHAFSAYSDAVLMLSEAEDPVGSVAALLAMAGFLIDVGEYEAAQSYLARALPLIDLLIDVAEGFPGNTAAMLTFKGQYLLLEGKLSSYTEGFATATTKIQEAYQIFQEVDNLQGQANALTNWGLAEKNLADFTGALDHLSQAQALYVQLGDLASEIDVIDHLGGLHRLLGEYESAEEDYTLAIERARQVGSRLREGAAWNNLGLLYQRQGRLSTALDAYQQALAITKDGGNPDAESTTLLNLATLYQDQGRLDLALEVLNQAQEIADAADLVGAQAVIRNSIGLNHLARKQYAEALAAFSAASDIAEQIGDWELLATVLNNMGRLHFEQEQYEPARSTSEQALKLARQLNLPALEAAILRNLGMIEIEQGHYAAGMGRIDQALASEPALNNPVGLALSQAAKGYAYRRQGQISQALKAYTTAIDLIESVRLQAGSEVGRTEFISQYQDLYNRVIELHLQQVQLEQAFEVSERGRARAFLDSLSTDYIELSDQDVAGLLQVEREAYARLQATREALALLQVQAVDAEQIEKLAAQLTEAEQVYQSALDQLEARSGLLASLAPGRSQILSLVEVQALLDEQTTLLSYWMLDTQTVAFVITEDELAVVELPEATTDAIATAVTNLHQWNNTANPHPRPLRNLYNWLVAPLADHLQTPQIALVPHQLLHYVPFGGLTDGETYFGQQYTLTQLPSASVMPFLSQNAGNVKLSQEPTALVLGDPATALPALPNAATEAVAVADLLTTSAFTGTMASELQLRSVISSVNVLHLAAHGEYNQANPFNSAIYLAPSSLDQTNRLSLVDASTDGRLEAYEIFGLPLQGNDLVVLSACQTNLNQLTDPNQVAVSPGDEIIGLTRAFFFAGAPTVLSSLWSVEDAATETLMVSFYTHWLQEGMSKAAAFQAAQADVRADPRWASPFFWAGFVLNGHGGEQ